MRYKLLTPGPLTTTDTVKREMMIDHCTWDDDYKSVTQKIRAGLLKLAHVSEEEYTSVLIQGVWQILRIMRESPIICVLGQLTNSRMHRR